MKQTLYFLLFLAFIQFSAQSLSGVLKDSTNQRKVVFNLKLKNIENKKEYFSHTDENGTYEFLNLKNGVYILSVIYDNFYLENKFDVQISGSTKANFYLKKFCKFRKNKTNICPVCKTNAGVQPIFYGLTTTTFMKKNKKKYHFGGCELSGCDPNWYCQKDKTEF